MTNAARKSAAASSLDQDWALERAPFIDAAESLANRIISAVASADAKACAACYTEDAVIFAPGYIPVTGQAEILKYFESVIAQHTVISTVFTMRAEADGRIGYLIQATVASTGNSTVVRMMRLTEEGVWRICAETVAA